MFVTHTRFHVRASRVSRHGFVRAHVRKQQSSTGVRAWLLLLLVQSKGAAWGGVIGELLRGRKGEAGATHASVSPLGERARWEAGV